MTDSGAARDASPRAAERAIGRRRSDRIVGSSRAIQDVIEQAIAAAASDLPVRIVGPVGAGKEQIARAIHGWSPRASGPFVVISCVGVPEALRGRELFGCAESTYPSLPEAYDGGLARASGGTLLIDHAEQLGSDLWQALAKALSDGRFQHEGDAGALPLAARLIAVSRSPLSSSALRELPHHEIEVAGLAERPEDILPLASHFLNQFNRAFNKGFQSIDPEAERILLAYPWPGNIRELRNLFERIVLLNQGDRILAQHLNAAIALPTARPGSRLESLREVIESGRFPEEGIDLESALGEVERQAIERAFHWTQGNQSRTAALLQMKRDKLRYRMKLYGFNDATTSDLG